MTVPRRLAAGAGAGMTATALTHPLDVVRLRLALPNSPYTGGHFPTLLPACLNPSLAHQFIWSIWDQSPLRSVGL